MHKFLMVILISLGLIVFHGCSQRSPEPNAATESDQTESTKKTEGKTPENGAEAGEEKSPETEEFVEEDEDFGEFEEEFAGADKEVFDPLSGYNRAMTTFNDKLYLWVLDPVARGYRFVVPEAVRKGINNFFMNLLYPIRLVNNLLQLKIKNAGEETLRFVTNSTIGLLGFFDPAEHWFGLEAHHEDFGQTLGYYGVGGGFHIVLPFLGPSNLRDMFSMYPDKYHKWDDKYYLDPLRYVDPDSLELALWALDNVNYTSLHIGEYQNLKKDAFDWYLFLRDSYEQKRQREIEE